MNGLGSTNLNKHLLISLLMETHPSRTYIKISTMVITRYLISGILQILEMGVQAQTGITQNQSRSQNQFLGMRHLPDHFNLLLSLLQLLPQAGHRGNQ
nr:hypothetical protein Iba_chr02aCG9950 [Ipomoea batatas]GMC60640.1 hypothetical protein Iba_chr02bCG12680 [Ipomoea batatas]GMC60641.1 hypothetical protein Iba_chr02bCG12690 [Ipomoea batatas]GMC63029.1 hypothetical protein Iba_chr02cCG9450 [Ipomoea batatas]GMC64323.1 hypothetical protein Iba_chr02dCG3870 [Ipomoea batatas]